MTHFESSFHLFVHPKYSKKILFVTLEWPKWLEMGSKMGSSHLFRQPKWRGIVFLKNTFFIHLLVAKQAIFKAFCDVGVAKMACKGLKMGSFHLFRHPKWPGIVFGKTHFSPIFDAFFTHFFCPKTTHFQGICDFGGAKMACNGLEMGSFHSFRHPKWPGIVFGKTHFSPIFCPKTPHFQGILAFLEGQGQFGPPRAQDAPKTIVLVFYVVHNDF